MAQLAAQEIYPAAQEKMVDPGMPWSMPLTADNFVDWVRENPKAFSEAFLVALNNDQKTNPKNGKKYPKGPMWSAISDIAGYEIAVEHVR